MRTEGRSEDDRDQLDALLTEWESLQTDIRHYKNLSHRRIISGTIVLAAVAGYALETSTHLLFAFIPVIIGLMFIVHVQETNHVYYRNWQCFVIEDRVAQLEIEDFDWVHEFGPLSRSDKVAPGDEKVGYFDTLSPHDVSWRQSPSGGSYIVGLTVYAVFVGLVLIFLPDMLPDRYAALAIPAVVGVFLFYALFTALLFVVGRSSWKILDDFAQDPFGKTDSLPSRSR